MKSILGVIGRTDFSPLETEEIEQALRRPIDLALDVDRRVYYKGALVRVESIIERDKRRRKEAKERRSIAFLTVKAGKDPRVIARQLGRLMRSLDNELTYADVDGRVLEVLKKVREELTREINREGVYKIGWHGSKRFVRTVREGVK